ncbi:MAG: glycosyltransferase [Deltaproteobacteria bacterium]|nr:glycosyltransferase [Deltaproteobacteria bacterium]MBW2119558.1 glycosyltransferase [Deltaproteobacteria bacterium]MBW2342571.1 glycosyltransferase [Deltaproteobacteria bacterium]
MKQTRITILHLITTLDVGGSEMMLLKLLSLMNRRLFSNCVVSFADIGPVGEKILAMGIPVYALNMAEGRLTLAACVKLWKILRAVRPMVLQTWLYHSDLLGVIFGKLSGIDKICWNIRCSYMDLNVYRAQTRWSIRLCSLLSSLPDAVVTNSNEALNFHVKILGYRTDHWEVIPNGFDLARFKPDKQSRLRLLAELGLPHNKESGAVSTQADNKNGNGVFLIGFIARYDPMKDHPTFIRAACLLLKERRDIHFVLVGRGITWQNRAFSMQIPDTWKGHFHLLGERYNIEHITSGLDVASSVSRGEGFPNSVGEAMACGIPCVVTDVGDSAIIVGDTGRVVPPGNPEATARAWNELVELGVDGRKKLGLSARKRVKDNFELSKIVKQYESLYNSLVKTR